MTELQELENLIQECKNGDAEAFNRLITLYSNRCYAYFFRLTGKTHVADELLSDLFLRLIKNTLFSGWFF